MGFPARAFKRQWRLDEYSELLVKKKVMIDYSEGQYTVRTAQGAIVGRIDNDEYVRSGTELLYRVDGDEMYSNNGDFLGDIEDGEVIAPTGEVLFRIVAE